MLDLFTASAANFFIDLLHSIWNLIKPIAVKILNFLQNIVGFFKDPARLRMLRQDSNKIAVAIKENLSNGEYNVVNCLFDKSTNEIVDLQENTRGFEAQSIDNQTMQSFGDKTMIILQ